MHACKTFCVKPSKYLFNTWAFLKLIQTNFIPGTYIIVVIVLTTLHAYQLTYISMYIHMCI